MKKDVKTKLDKMNLTEKFLFDEVMEQTESYEAAVSILLEREIHLLSPAQSEKEFRVSPEIKTARLDIIGTDEIAERSASERLKQIHEVVKRVKLSEKMGVRMMQRWEEDAILREEAFNEGHNQGVSQGLSQGRREGLVVSVQKMVKNM